jgi:hypothetical protein
MASIVADLKNIIIRLETEGTSKVHCGRIGCKYNKTEICATSPYHDKKGFCISYVCGDGQSDLVHEPTRKAKRNVPK